MTDDNAGTERAMGAVAACLRGRRTIALFEPRPVDRQILLDAIDVARWAPNHHVTQPWHFYLLGEVTRRQLVALNAEVVSEKKNAEIGERKRKQWGKVPGWVAVTCTTSDEPLRQREDYAACCCAIHGFSLYLWQAGVGMKWSTGPVTRERRLYELLGVDPRNETMVALISYGYPQRVPEQCRDPLADIVTELE